MPALNGSLISCAGSEIQFVVPVNEIDAPIMKLAEFVEVTLFVIVIVEHGFDDGGAHDDALITAVIPA